MSALSPWLAVRARVSGTRTAVAVAGAELTWSELHDRARAGASRLRELGVGPGDRVAVLLENGLPFAELVHAAVLSGAMLLPLNLRLTPRELAPLIVGAKPKLVIHGPGALAACVRAIAPVGTRTLEVSGCSLTESTAARADSLQPVAFDAALAALFTSGTSGVPKAAVLTHANFHWSALASAAHLGTDADDRWLVCMPLFHVGGLSILIRGLLYGNTVVVHERFDAETVDRALERDRITHVSLVATMLARLLEIRAGRPAPDTLRCVLLGGGPAPAGLIERAVAAGFRVAPTYGLTEASSQVATRPPGTGSAPVGGGLLPLVGTEVRIASEGGHENPVGVPGEVQVRGPIVMRGYLDRPDASAAAFEGGWLRTGDEGVRAVDGGITILDRRSDLIVSGGENIYPSEVEAVLLEHPAIADAGVVAEPDVEFGQRPAAFLVLRPGETFSADDLRDFCRTRLAGFKIPVRFECIEALPRTGSGKLKRRRLGA